MLRAPDCHRGLHFIKAILPPPFSRYLRGGGTNRIDFAFIDGDHRIRGILSDWQVVDPLLCEGAFVLLHDTVPERCHWLGPRYLIEHLDRKARKSYPLIDVPTPDGFGLTVIQKRAAGKSPHLWPSAWQILVEKLFNRCIGWHKRR